METRPRYRPEWTNLQKILEATGFLAIVLMWGFTLYSFRQLPDRVPIHYNASGQPDGFGEKYMLLLLPSIMTGVYILINIVGKRPWNFNYLVPITEENYRSQYGDAVNMLRLLKLIIALFSLYIVYGNIRNATGNTAGLHPYTLPLFIIALFLTLGIHIFKSIRKK